jgi:hypothetical protein
VFLGSFIPGQSVHQSLSGVLAIFIALVYPQPRPRPFLTVLGVVIGAVRRLRGHVLQPFIMGTAAAGASARRVPTVAAGGFLRASPEPYLRCRSSQL